MQIPNLPTDNLYKFMALSGLILIILSAVFPLWLLHNIGLEHIEIKKELDLLDIEERYLREEQEEAREGLKALPPNKKIEARRSIDEKAKDYSKKLMQTKGNFEKMKYLVSEAKKLKIFSCIGAGVGAIVTYCGFLLWYRRLQKYQDQIIKSEAQKQLQNNSEQK